MVGQAGMRNESNIAFRHMTTGAVVRRLLALTSRNRQRAAFLRVALQTFLAIKGRSFGARWFDVRVMTRNAGKLCAAGAIALAENHRKIVLNQVGLWRRFARRRHNKNGDRVVWGGARFKVALDFARFEPPPIPG